MSRSEPPPPMPTRLEALAMEIYADDRSGEDPADLLRELLRDQIATKLVAFLGARDPVEPDANAQRVVGQDESPATKSRALRSP